MPSVIKLTCPSCGGKLQITDDIDHFFCNYCGNELIVQRNGWVFTIAPVVEGLEENGPSFSKKASELAIVRLEKDISKLMHERSEIPHEADNGCFLLLIMCVASLVIISLVMIWVGGDYILALYLFCAGIALYGLVLWLRSVNASNKKNSDKEIANFDQMIARKRQELIKHRYIVRH